LTKADENILIKVGMENEFNMKNWALTKTSNWNILFKRMKRRNASFCLKVYYKTQSFQTVKVKFGPPKTTYPINFFKMI
jgi:hypothetical protein